MGDKKRTYNQDKIKKYEELHEHVEALMKHVKCQYLYDDVTPEKNEAAIVFCAEDLDTRFIAKELLIKIFETADNVTIENEDGDLIVSIKIHNIYNELEQGENDEE